MTIELYDRDGAPIDSDGPPLIFETMVFALDDDGPCLGENFDQRRYPTEAEARDGHAATVLLVQATTELDA